MQVATRAEWCQHFVPCPRRCYRSRSRFGERLDGFLSLPCIRRILETSKLSYGRDITNMNRYKTVVDTTGVTIQRRVTLDKVANDGGNNALNESPFVIPTTSKALLLIRGVASPSEMKEPEPSRTPQPTLNKTDFPTVASTMPDKSTIPTMVSTNLPTGLGGRRDKSPPSAIAPPAHLAPQGTTTSPSLEESAFPTTQLPAAAPSAPNTMSLPLAESTAVPTSMRVPSPRVPESPTAQQYQRLQQALHQCCQRRPRLSRCRQYLPL
jgi:hypothetical protein